MLNRRTMLAASLIPAAGSALAQDYPTKSTRIVVPFAPGGGGDIIARILAQKLTEAWGQTVVVDNRPGAGGNIGAEIVAKAAPDGYTLLLTSTALTTNPSLYAKVPYDPVKDFKPITRPALLPNILVVPASLPVRDVKELVALSKTEKLSYASAGSGTGTHLAAELFKQLAGIELTHIPYKGGGAVNIDLLAGRVALTFATLASVIAFVHDGRLRALAVAGTARWPGLPDVPTMQEVGFRDFDISTWTGLLAPANTPDNVINKVHRDVVGIVNTAEVRDRFMSLGIVPVGDNPAQFAAYIKTELVKYEKLVRASGAKID